MPQLTKKSPYAYKDQCKADVAGKFIGVGSPNSSTNQYAKDYGEYANTGIYDQHDSIFISAEGNRSGRINPNFDEIGLAIKAGAILITDTPYNRNRSYNVGERQVAAFLEMHNYQESVQDYYSIWTPA